jgi:hypothetical protein
MALARMVRIDLICRMPPPPTSSRSAPSADLINLLQCDQVRAAAARLFDRRGRE